MFTINEDELLSFYCTAHHKWCLYLGLHTEPSCGNNVREIMLAAPFLSEEEADKLFIDEVLYVIFDTEEELYKCFQQVAMDEGHAEDNNYDGPCKIYASVWSPKDGCVDENT